jgi:hypothetical protein
VPTLLGGGRGSSRRHRISQLASMGIAVVFTDW